ncbi:hypothetical protein [Psychrobacter sp. WY6]|uniref:hypothetical protein n=1 Tax=Psychrobacter sp. WY6 TaxID=2708350 RepID=UPI002022F3AB|nr:hypothetical protein [Psychrobacter sp. WY6]
MSIETDTPNKLLPHQLFHGTTWHSRLLPSVHKFAYPYRYCINISALAKGLELPEVSTGMSSKNKLLKKLLSKDGWSKDCRYFQQRKSLAAVLS